MKFESNYLSDTPKLKDTPGSYDWWYFDGSDRRGEYQFVIIFYEGCPFSTRYIRSIERHPDHVNSKAKAHPAVSISVYRNGKKIFYSLVEYSPNEVEFNRDKISIRVGKNTVEGFVENGQLVYALRMEEILPTGDKFSALLRYVSPFSNGNLWGNAIQSSQENHAWNLVQPRAQVKGVISVSQQFRHEKPIIFEGTGYHDHNTGTEPVKNAFKEWYWGRVHFGDVTLVYYLMKKSGSDDLRAWLISADNKSILETSQEVTIDGISTNAFFLSSARRINIVFGSCRILLQAEEILDSGPFYMRFKFSAEMQNTETNHTEISIGIGEYLRPARIHKSIFWPLMRMRFRYAFERPHWVQKSRILYKWTW